MRTVNGMKSYRETPLGITQVLQLFHHHNLNYLLFKCDHIFEGQNKNLDILFETNEEYARAAALLEQQGFAVRLSEKIEKYKTMYCGLIDETMYSIHLHREIAWHGMKALDKKPVFQNARHVHSFITIPGTEDLILIHAAHVLFENFKVKERERNYFLTLKEPSINKEYIRWQIQKNNWEKGFWEVIRAEQLSKVQIGKRWLQKIWKDPMTAAYLFLKVLRVPLRKIGLRRKGCLIALMGVNGSGKSTLAKKILEKYEPLTKHLGISQTYYYFGWKPTFPLTKIGSFFLLKAHKKVFHEINLQDLQKPIPSFDLKQELLFIYLWGEFLFRYYREVYPLLRKGDLVVCDRYSYDLYGQYPYARNSRIIKILLTLFPTPDYNYITTAPIKEIMNRKKTKKELSIIEQTQRKVLPQEYLLRQIENYDKLTKMIPSSVINTCAQREVCASQIISETWKKVI